MGGLFCVLNGAASARAQDVKTIIDKTNAVYLKMKSMQALLDTEIRSDNKLTGRSLADIKTIRGKSAYIRIRPQSQTTSGKDQAKSSTLVLDDGKFSWLFQEREGRYIRRPHSPMVFATITNGGFGLPYGGLNPSLNFKLAAPATVEGAPAYVLEYAPPNQADTIVSLYIDQKTYHLRRARVTRVTRPVYSVTTTVHNEVLNATIPESAFAFRPPRGAIEVRPTTTEGSGPTVPTMPVVPPPIKK